jgi:23S rRNA pseudouridine1911/1915/1917 synthase
MDPLSIDQTAVGMRLDIFLVERWAKAQAQLGLSRAEIQRLIDEGQITLNGAPAKASARLKVNDRIDIRRLPARETALKAEALPLEILYEDADCLVVNKAAGMVVHAAAGQPSGTLVNALLHHCADLAAIGGERRPGIVHRLDKETSGVMIVAKNMFAFHQLVGQFKNRRVGKEYLAVAWGQIVPDEGRIDRPIGRHRSDRKRMSSLRILNKSRAASTEWRVEERFAWTHGPALFSLSLVRLWPRTGRTHQLRVHLADMGYPLVGDKIYGRKRTKAIPSHGADPLLDGFPRQALHAEKLAVDHVRSGKRMEFRAPLAADMTQLLVYLRALNGGTAARAAELSSPGVDKVTRLK